MLSGFNTVYKQAPHTVGDSLLCDTSRILTVALLVELDATVAHVCLLRQQTQVSDVDAQLLHRTTPERIAGCDQDSEVVLEKPEAHLAEISGLPDTIYSNECNGVGCALAGRCTIERAQFGPNRQQQIGRGARGKNTCDGVRERIPNLGLHPCD